MGNIIFLVSSGTIGDILPFCALGACLIQRGYRVTMLTSSDYHAVVTSYGIDFAATRDPDLPQDRRDDRKFWLECVVPGYRKGVEHVMGGPAVDPVIVVRDNDWTGPFLAERLGVQFVRVVLQPSSLVNKPRRFGDEAIALLNGIRRELGLPSRDTFFHHPDYGQPTICFFPEWFGASRMLSEQTLLYAGFPHYRSATMNIGARLASFLNRHRRVAIFSPSTGISNIEEMETVAYGYHEASGVPTLLLGRDEPTTDDNIPTGFMVKRFANHNILFDYALFVAHNGGIGTVAQCLRSATPQIITPLRYDQPDNARRVAALELGVVIPHDELTHDAVRHESSRLLSDLRLRSRSDHVSQLVRQGDAILTAANYIESLIRGNHLNKPYSSWEKPINAS